MTTKELHYPCISFLFHPSYQFLFVTVIFVIRVHYELNMWNYNNNELNLKKTINALLIRRNVAFIVVTENLAQSNQD